MSININQLNSTQASFSENTGTTHNSNDFSSNIKSIRNIPVYPIEKFTKEAFVLFKIKGNSYRTIFSSLMAIQKLSGHDRLEAELKIHQKAEEYIEKHPKSGRNSAMKNLREFYSKHSNESKLTSEVATAQTKYFNIQQIFDGSKSLAEGLSVEAESPTLTNKATKTETPSIIIEDSLTFAQASHQPHDASIIRLNNEQYGDIFGQKIGSGATCNVYQHKNDSSLVLKSFSDGEYKDKLHAAKNELSAFSRYYGDDAAIIITNGSDVSLQLVKVPGKSLSDLNGEKLPSNAINIFFDMVLRMNDAGLYHDDLSINNIFYDENTNQFYPIDFSTTLDSFFELSDGGKRYFHTIENKKLNNVINYIKANTVI